MISTRADADGHMRVAETLLRRLRAIDTADRFQIVRGCIEGRLDRIERIPLPDQTIVVAGLAVIDGCVKLRLPVLSVANVDAVILARRCRIAGITRINHRRTGQRPIVVRRDIGKQRIKRNFTGAICGLACAIVDPQISAVGKVIVVLMELGRRGALIAYRGAGVEGKDRVAHIDTGVVRRRDAIRILDDGVVDDLHLRRAAIQDDCIWRIPNDVPRDLQPRRAAAPVNAARRAIAD